MSQSEPPRPRTFDARIPRDLETIVLQSISKDPKRRYQSTDELSEDLRRFVNDEPIHARRVSSVERFMRWSRRNPLVASSSTLAAGALIAITVISTLFARAQTDAVSEQRHLNTALAKSKTAAEMARQQEQSLRVNAERARSETERRLRVVSSLKRGLESNAVREYAPIRSLLLAVEAVNSTHRFGEPVVPSARETLLNSLARVSGQPLTGHTSQIWVQAISNDSRWLATAGDDHTVCLWDMESRDPSNLVTVLTGHEDAVRYLAWSEDARKIVSASSSGVLLWDRDRTDPSFQILLKPNNGIRHFVTNRDGKWLAVVGHNVVDIWDLQSDAPQTTRRTLHAIAQIDSATISPDGNLLVCAEGDSGKRNSRIYVWNLSAHDQSPDPLVLAGGHKHNVRTVAVSPNSRWLASGSEDTTALLWDLTTGDPSPIILPGHEASVNQVHFGPDNRWLLTKSAGKDGLRLWDLSDDNPAGRSLTLGQLQGGYDPLATSSNGRWLAAAVSDGVIHLWDFQRGDARSFRTTLQTQGRVRQLLFSADDRWLIGATSTDGAIIYLWDLTSGDVPSAMAQLHGLDGSTNSIATSPDARWLVAGGGTYRPEQLGELRLWDLSSHDLSDSQRHSHGLPANCSYVSPGGRWVATGHVDKRVRLFERASNGSFSPTRVLKGFENDIARVTISQNGRWLVAIGRNLQTRVAEGRVWDLHADNPGDAHRVLTGLKGFASELVVRS